MRTSAGPEISATLKRFKHIRCDKRIRIVWLPRKVCVKSLSILLLVLCCAATRACQPRFFGDGNGVVANEKKLAG